MQQTTTKQFNILWTGREYYSLENCLVSMSDHANIIDSVIVGSYESKIYRVDYQLTTNKQWETQSLVLKAQHDNKIEHIQLLRHQSTQWLLNNELVSSFDGCTDVDIPLTPFTNTLPVNRLKMEVGVEAKIKVIYVDVLLSDVKPVSQQYKRLSLHEYHYQNIPNDFEAKIIVDENGFVVDYPLLFVRTLLQQTNYKAVKQ